MKIVCLKCGVPLTRDLVLYTGRSFGEGDGQAFIQPGYYAFATGESFYGKKGDLVVNRQDVINVADHDDPVRASGCCGKAGTNGLNLVCTNHHEVATEKSDCWMPHAVIFENNKVILK